MSIKKPLNRNILATLLLIGLICVVFLLFSFQVDRQAVDACFRTLDDATAQVVAEISTCIRSDREHLEIIADLLARHDSLDSDTIRSYFSSFRQRGSIFAIGLLFPDHRMILGGAETGIPEDTLNFSLEMVRSPYVSGVIPLPGNETEKMIYHAVPVKKDEQTLGILYGFVDLADFAANLTVTAFDGNAQVFVADGRTGDFLVDTWHDSLGNVFDADIMSREARSGYDFRTMKSDFREGRAGHIAFWSNSAQEYFYSCYKPAGFDNWMVQLTVLESIVLSDALRIRRALLCIAALEIVSFAAYFLWVLFNVRRDAARKNQRLAQSLYMYDVQQALFDAYKTPSLFTAALQQVAATLTARAAFFLALDGDTIKEAFFYPPEAAPRQETYSTLSRNFSQAYQRLASGRSLLLQPERTEDLTDAAATGELSRRGIGSLMLSPVLRSDRTLVGVLGCVNMRRRFADASLLECVSRNFQMALRNMRLYRQVEAAGTTDVLTGLRNRFCYEHALEGLLNAGTQPSCCLYIDANGLHDLNNTLGHAAGDAMLVCVADALRRFFSPKDCYRIGGDEFTVLCSDCGREELHRRLDQIIRQVTAAGYSISVGEAWLEDSPDAQEMVALAEKSMYEAKRQYYQKTGNLSRARLMNQKLEHLLREKQDSDAFLDILSSRFMGACIVNLKTDAMRTIYKPAAFSDMLKDKLTRFLPCMQAYCSACVVREDQERLLSFLDYDAIRSQLISQREIRCRYRTSDGLPLLLRIYPTRGYGSAGCEEIICLFEKAAD